MDLEQRVGILEDEVQSLKTTVSSLQAQLAAKQAMSQQVVQPVSQTVVKPQTVQVQPAQVHHCSYPSASQNVNPTVQSTISVQKQPVLFAGSKSNPQSNINAAGVANWTKEQQAQTVKQHQQKKNTDMEQFIGKNVFVIVASILVFIGVVVFASVLLPYLPQEVKFILMCIASLGFFGFSYWFIQHKQNAFSIGLLACSLGTIYITLFTGNLYFKIINTVLLYIALLLWTMIIYYCSRYKFMLFNIIGQAGILLSLILCMAEAVTKLDSSFVLYALIYVTIAEIAYDLLFKDKGHLVNMISMLLSVSILSFPIIYTFEADTRSIFLPHIEKITMSDMFSQFGGNCVAFIILMCLFGYAIVKNVILCKSDRVSSVVYSIINAVGIFVFMTSLGKFEWTDGVGIVMGLYCILIFVITEFLYYDEDRDVLSTILSSLLFCIVVILYYNLFDSLWISGLILIVPIAAYLFMTETECSKVVLYVGLGITTLCNVAYCADSSMRFVIKNTDLMVDIDWSKDITTEAILSGHNIIYYVSCLVFAVLCHWFVIRRDDNKSVMNVIGYLFVVANVWIPFCYMSSYAEYRFDVQLCEHAEEIFVFLRLVLAFIIQFAFWHMALFEKEDDIFKQGSYVAYFVVNAIMMIFAIWCLYELDEYNVGYLFGVIVTVALFTINSLVLLRKQNTALAIYVGIKMTVLIFVIMHVFDLAPLVSVLLFVWAVACIVLGLKLTQKSLRIYALILAMISAAKLVLIDISYSNILSRAFSFIICGVLCFVISYIYHKIEKSNLIDESVNN